MCSVIVVFLCKQKTAYEMRISDWSSDVCSSDLHMKHRRLLAIHAPSQRFAPACKARHQRTHGNAEDLRGFLIFQIFDGDQRNRLSLRLGKIGQLGRASCRERVCQYAEISGVDVTLKTNHKHTRLCILNTP